MISQYIKNLLTALRGGNPYTAELEELKEKYKRTAEHVCALNDLYYKALEKWKEAEQSMVSSQVLIENLRRRIAEKDAELGQYVQNCRVCEKRLNGAGQ